MKSFCCKHVKISIYDSLAAGVTDDFSAMAKKELIVQETRDSGDTILERLDHLRYIHKEPGIYTGGTLCLLV